MTLLQATTLPEPQQTVPRSFVRLGALATGIIVTNLFAPQTLVGLIGPSLGANAASVGLVAMATLLGYAAGLFFLVPLADLAENRALILRMLIAAALAAAMAVGADDVHADLAAGVSAEHRAVLDQHHLAPGPRRRDRRTNAGHATAGHQDVTVDLMLLHGFLVSEVSS